MRRSTATLYSQPRHSTRMAGLFAPSRPKRIMVSTAVFFYNGRTRYRLAAEVLGRIINWIRHRI